MISLPWSAEIDVGGFFSKAPFLAILAQNGPKNGPKSAFLPVSRNFVITFDCNLCQNVLCMVTNQIAPFVRVSNGGGIPPCVKILPNPPTKSMSPPWVSPPSDFCPPHKNLCTCLPQPLVCGNFNRY